MKKLLILLVTLSAFACGDGSKQGNEGNESESSNLEQTEENSDEMASPDTTTQTNEGDTTTIDNGAVQP